MNPAWNVCGGSAPALWNQEFEGATDAVQFILVLQKEIMCELDGSKTAKAGDGRNLPANVFLGHFMKPYFKDKTTGIVSKYKQLPGWCVFSGGCALWCVWTVLISLVWLNVTPQPETFFLSLVTPPLLEMFVQPCEFWGYCSYQGLEHSWLWLNFICLHLHNPAV